MSPQRFGILGAVFAGLAGIFFATNHVAGSAIAFACGIVCMLLAIIPESSIDDE